MKVQCDFCRKTADAIKQLDKNSGYGELYKQPRDWVFRDGTYGHDKVCLCPTCKNEYDKSVKQAIQLARKNSRRPLEDSKECSGCGDWGAPQGCEVCGIRCMGG